MLTADQRKELEALQYETSFAAQLAKQSTTGSLSWEYAQDWADRIAAVLANGVEEG